MKTIVKAIFLRNGEVLLGRRSLQRVNYPGLWSFPGGHVEPGETLDQALLRETMEELAVLPLVYEKCGTLQDPVDPLGVTYHLFTVRAWRGRPRIMDDEHSELRWFTLDAAAALGDLALPAYRQLFSSLQASHACNEG